VPDFNVDLNSIADVSNVSDRSLIKKGIATIADSICYKRISDFILVEIKYRNLSVKHVLVIDNKQSKVVVNFSIEYHENSHDYTCNGFILKYVKSPEEFHLMGVNIEDYAHMMNFVDFISDNEAKKIKEYLVSNLSRVLISNVPE
ncbi:TPA: recombinase family protein, partial [Escherichia coli]|nr:recombinase family protein [Escherichia coli]